MKGGDTGGWLEGDGEMIARVRTFDWSKTPVGPIAGWPVSLRTIVAAMLHSRHPMFLWWGPELTQFYNDAYMPSFGVGKHPAALGQRGRECWPEIWSIIGPQIEDAMQRGQASWHEDALVPIFRNGMIEDVYWTYGYSPVYGDDGRIAGTLVVCTETTTRVLATQSEQRIRAEVEAERARLRTFFSQVPAGVCILRGPSLVFDFVNERYYDLVGRRELLGRPLLSGLPELAGQGLDELMHRVMATCEPFVGHEVPVKIDRGGTGAPADHFYTFIYSPLREAGVEAPASSGGADGVIVVAFDVTAEVVARREAEELERKLRESEDRFHLLAETIPQLAWTARPDGYIDWYNRRWYDYTGTTFEQMQGWGWKAVHDPQVVDEVVARWTAALGAGEPFEMQFPLRRTDGVFRWHLTRAMPLRDASGSITRWFGTNTDIDDSRRAEMERMRLLESEKAARLTAEVASRAKDDFLATASHELRTPLNAILGWARILRTAQLPPNDRLRGLETIERNAKSQVRLIEDILDGSRIITGNLHLEVHPIDLEVVVRAALEAVGPAAAAKRIALSVSIEPEVGRTVGDPERLQQVVWNLVSNAIKFTPKDGRIDVSMRRVGTDIEMRVADSGEGISAEFLPHVFERFRQAEGSTTRRHAGLGLGLALVQYLIEAHGGTVRADSDGPGCGAVFTVRLPVQAVYPRPSAAPGPATLGGERALGQMILRGVNALVVDDEADARDLVATVLRASGADVTTAPNAAQALDLIERGAFTVLVSDVGMPATDGHALIRSIRALRDTGTARIRAIALTAYAREEDRRLAAQAGFDTHVAKPVEPDELVRLVAALLAAAPAEPRS